MQTAGPWKRLAFHFFRTMIALGVLVIAGEALIWLFPSLYIWAAVAADQKSLCRAGDAYRGAEQYREQDRQKQEIERGTKLVRKDGQYSLLETPGGKWWIPAGSETVVPSLLAQQKVRIYGPGFIHPDDVVFDCGAHIGVYTRTALDGGARLVVAIEPAPANLECLRRNFQSEIAANKVVVVPKGVWDKEDELVLFEDPKNSAADGFVVQGQGQKAGSKLALTTIDHIAADLKLDRVDVIKMDIKGATERALRGAGATLARSKPRLALSTEEFDIDDPGKLAAFIQNLGLGYRRACGLCVLASPWVVTPDVLLFN